MWRRTRRVGRRCRRQRRQRWRRRACTQTAPSRTVTIDKLGTARPCTADEELIRVGQTVCILPSRKEGIGREWHARPGDGRAWGGGGAGSGQRGLYCGGCWQGMRGAHIKHVLHVCDAGRVEAQRLVKRRRVLPSRNGSIGRGATCEPGGGRAWGARGASSVLGGPPTLQAAGRARAERT